MKRHARIPAAVALVVTASAGLAVLAAAGQLRVRDIGGGTLEDIEKRIVGSNDAALWAAYGDKLAGALRFADAAQAYERAIALQPDLADARLNAGVALAQARDADKFFEYVAWLSMMYPKQAVDLLQRAEMGGAGGMRGDVRFVPAAATAHSQAVD